MHRVFRRERVMSVFPEQQIRDILLDLWEFGYDFAMTDKEKYSKALCVEDAVAAILGLESEK